MGRVGAGRQPYFAANPTAGPAPLWRDAGRSLRRCLTYARQKAIRGTEENAVREGGIPFPQSSGNFGPTEMQASCLLPVPSHAR